MGRGRYLAQIRGFEKSLEGRWSSLSQGAVRLMYMLLLQFDRAGFPERLEIDAEMLAMQCGCVRKTLLKFRDELVAQNLIELVDGAGSRPVGYRLRYFEIEEEPVNPEKLMGLDFVLALWSVMDQKINQYAEYNLSRLIRLVGVARAMRGMLYAYKADKLKIDDLLKGAMYDAKFGKPAGNFGSDHGEVVGSSGGGYDSLVRSSGISEGQAGGDWLGREGPVG